MLTIYLYVSKVKLQDDTQDITLFLYKNKEKRLFIKEKPRRKNTNLLLAVIELLFGVVSQRTFCFKHFHIIVRLGLIFFFFNNEPVLFLYSENKIKIF